MEIELQLLDVDLAVAKLSEIGNPGDFIEKATFVSLTKTGDELSLVIDEQYMPDYQYVNEGWRAFKIVGPLDFSLVGIIQQVIHPLSENGISIFTISTFDTDYILVKKEQLERATKVLQQRFKINTSASL